MFEQALQAIKDYDTIIVHRHNRPDGDALGSQIGLATIIKDNFPDKRVYMVGDGAARYSFMENSVMDEIPDDYFNGALSIVLDCGAAHLISDERYKLAAKTVRFDHHIYCEDICDIDIVDSTYESCCGIIAMFAKANGLKLSPLSATSLYTGMLTDSGRFRYDSTNARTFELAAFLMSQPINLNELHYNLYAEDFEALQQRAHNLLKIKFTEHNVAYIYTERAELESSGESFFNALRGYVGLMSDIKGVFIWVNFVEQADGVHAELRSNRYNINPLAVKYGGGGHKKASGCTVPDRDTAMALLADLDALATTDNYD